MPRTHAAHSPPAVSLDATLQHMRATYIEDPDGAVTSGGFIKPLHEYLHAELSRWLTPVAVSRGVKVMNEANVHAYVKTKKVDVALIDPINGPLMLIGVRSQMSSISKNVLTYWEGIVGECVSLQTRFPMSVHGYLYLHPKAALKDGRQSESIDHARYARMFAKNAQRIGNGWEGLRGYFDQFAYMVVDFSPVQPILLDSIVSSAAPRAELAVSTFVRRLVGTYNDRFGDLADYLQQPS